MKQRDLSKNKNNLVIYLVVLCEYFQGNMKPRDTYTAHKKRVLCFKVSIVQDFLN